MKYKISWYLWITYLYLFLLAQLSLKAHFPYKFLMTLIYFAANLKSKTAHYEHSSKRNYQVLFWW